MNNIKEMLARVVGMQTEKARRATAEATFDVLKMCGIGARVQGMWGSTIVTQDVQVSFDTGCITLDSWVLDAALHLRKDTSPSDVVTVVQGLSLHAEQVIADTNGDDEAELDWDLDLFYVPSDAHKNREWTRSATPPECCGQAMTEHAPDLHIGPGGIFAERIFSCQSCLQYQYVEVTDSAEKELLHSEADKW